MVSARYHLVSLAAVLFALAAGVVLGAGPLARAVNDTVASPRTSASPSAAAAAAALKAASTYDEAALASVSSRLLAGRLSGQTVVLVLLPGTSRPTVDAVTSMVRTAGGSVTGEVALTPAWADPNQLDVLVGITDQLAPPDSKPATDQPTDRAAAALASALVTKKTKRLGRTADTSTALLAGLAQGGFLATRGQPAQAASLSIVLGPAQTVGATAFVPLAQAMDASGSGAVVAAPRGSASPTGIVGAVRAQAAARAAVSSVDCVDLAAGRLAAVLALAAERDGSHGQYGLGPGADTPFPRPKASGG
ncbi:MAG: copper transporter [Actinomycetes bacterium]